jgi:hypothetical protein
MSDTTPDQCTDVPTTTQTPRERLAKRLREAGLDTQRCCPVEDDTKVSYDHYARKTPSERTGNYTVHGGDGLVVLDLDVPRDDLPEWVNALPETFESGTPHGGRHLYYAVPEDARVSNAKASGDDGWGSVRFDGLYVVGPGSSIDHGEYCDDGKEGCPGTGVGEYPIKQDRSIATLTGDDLDRLVEVCEGDESAEGPDTSNASVAPSETGDDAEWTSLDESTRRRIERAKGFDKWGDQFTALIEGRYSDAGFLGDRSEAEYRLIYLLGWLFGDDKTVVRRAMTAICRLNPQTDVREHESRKWLERADDTYRDDTLNKACQHDSTYNLPTARPYENRPDVAAGTKSGVFEAVLDLRIASSQEIADHEAVDRSQRQVRRALREQEDEIQSKKVGRRRVYYIDTAFIPADKRDEYDL